MSTHGIKRWISKLALLQLLGCAHLVLLPGMTVPGQEARAAVAQEAQSPASSPAMPAQQTPEAPAPAASSVSPQQPTPPAPAPATQAPELAETVPIALHLENADLLQVIGIIASELKINYVVDPEVQGTVNINTLGQLQRADLFPLLQTVLRINGATAVQTGNLYRIVPLRDVQRLPIAPLYEAGAATLPADDRMVMNIVPLKYFSAADMSKILTPFLSEGGHLFSLEQGNILILTEASRSMQRLLELVALLDTETFTHQRVRLYPIQNSQAVKVAEEMHAVFSAYALSESASAVRFVAMERINALLVVAANPAVFPEVERWLGRLDQPLAESGVRTFIYKVENGKAADLASVLTQLLVGGFPSLSGTQQPAQGAGAAAAQPAAAVSPQLLGAAGLPGATFGPLPHIRIVPDTVNNQLVIQATAQEYEQIRQTLRDLDIVPRQVMIEAKVYEVDLTGALSAGVSAFLQNRTEAERKPLAGFGAPSAGSAPSLSASVGTLVGKTRELLLFLQVAEARSQARVISAPSILASDNLSASLSVGTEIPILTSQAIVGGAQVAGTNLFTNTIQNRDTGVLLSITPRINSSGLVNLQIQQEVSAPLPPTAGAIQSPSIQKRSVSTQVVVQTGETIALGGIIQESRTLSRNRIPLLGDIPYLGALFGNTSFSSQRTELIILLTPTVIRDQAEARQATREFRDKLREVRNLLEEEERKAAERQQEQQRREQETRPQSTPPNPAPEAHSIQRIPQEPPRAAVLGS